jgi:hypothetical protein
MAAATLWIIELLGRYAVLLLLPLVALAGFAWLLLFDSHPYAALAASIVVAPLLIASVALAIGVLIVPTRRLDGEQVTRDQAPGLWALWDGVDPPRRRRRKVMIDDELNASMAELRGPLGIGCTEVLTVGLPLLMVMDVAAMRAIVSHEAAHARLAHASGSANLADFIDAFDMLFFYADPDDTVVGALAYRALHGALRRLERERRAASRRDEHAADRYAGDLRGDMARSLILLNAAGRSLHSLVYAPAERELLGAMTPPPSPIKRLVDQLAEIHGRGVVETLREPEAPASPELEADERLHGSTHPPFEVRLQSLGYGDPPEIAPVAAPASAALIERNTLGKLIDLFDVRWRRYAERMVGGA